MRSTLSTALLTAVVTPLSMVPGLGATTAFAPTSVAPTVVLSLVLQRSFVQGFARSGIRSAPAWWEGLVAGAGRGSATIGA